MAPFAVTIFLGALLLFLLQPIIGRFILPWFGGSASVWTTCLLFFQVGLLAGYAYAHAISRRAAVARWIHLALLAASLCFLPIAVNDEMWKPSPDSEPTWKILLLLAVNVGLPFFLLASTTPLLTRCFAQTFPVAAPYRLYALSNAGSLLALLSYPFLLEPLLTLSGQATLWSWIYGAFLVGCGWCVFRSPASDAARSTAPTHADRERPRGCDLVLWLSLSACGSTMLVATTTQLCQEVAVVPLLWVLPLALYVSTFIICFDSPRWYRRRVFVPLLALMMLPACAVLYAGPLVPLLVQVLVYSLTLLACCMTCHGELAAAKPPPRDLTLFYLCVAAGGAAGGIFVALIAPRIFPGYWEYHLAVGGSCLLTAWATLRNGAWDYRQATGLRYAVGVGCVALCVVLGGEMYFGQFNAKVTVRNFYGVLRLTSGRDHVGRFRRLVHGRIDHGRQYLDAQQRGWPTLYFGPGSGIDLAVRYHPRSLGADGPRRLRIGVVGLGVGIIAAYGQPGDEIVFYEINPAVERLCQQHFTFVKDSRASCEIVLGDARVSMERELQQDGSRQFDVLAVDAFRNDAIPMHLLTEECAELYFRHLRDDGLLLLHISNRFVNLAPVARGIANRFGHAAIEVISADDRQRGNKSGVWMILTRNRDFLSHDAIRSAATPGNPVSSLLWTDDFAAIWHVLK